MNSPLLKKMVQPAPVISRGNDFSDPLKTVSGLKLVHYPQDILKLGHPSSLDYRVPKDPDNNYVSNLLFIVDLTNLCNKILQTVIR